MSKLSPSLRSANIGAAPAPAASGYDHLIKLLVIGDSGVGKSCLLLRFCDDSFTPSFISTIGIDFTSKNVSINGRTVRLQLWDTAGQERFRTLIPSYVRDSAVTVVVYDVTSRASFEAVDHWVADVRRERGSDVILALVGNKNDLLDQRQVTPEDGEAKARAIAATLFLETSAKTGNNVKSLFLQIAAALGSAEPPEESAAANLIDVKLKGSDARASGTASSCAC